MTPEERYRDIYDSTEGFKAHRNTIRNLIVKHIREAVSEHCQCKETVKDIRVDTLEQAAELAESYLMLGAPKDPQFPQIARNLAEQIRGLKDKG